MQTCKSPPALSHRRMRFKLIPGGKGRVEGKGKTTPAFPNNLPSDVDFSECVHLLCLRLRERQMQLVGTMYIHIRTRCTTYKYS